MSRVGLGDTLLLIGSAFFLPGALREWISSEESFTNGWNILGFFCWVFFIVYFARQHRRYIGYLENELDGERRKARNDA